MPTIMTHALVGGTVGSLTPVDRRRRLFWTICAALAVLPDLDVIAQPFGFRSSMLAHRGLSHSLPMAVACGVIAALIWHDALGVRRSRLAVFFTIAMASHGVLDGLTDGGAGIAYLAPFSAARFHFPWRPIEVSPIGLDFFGQRGLSVSVNELVYVWLPVAALIVARVAWRAWRRYRKAETVPLASTEGDAA